MRKHIFNKHAEKVAAVKADVEFFNNFLRDLRRPQLPEKPRPKPAPPAPAPSSSRRPDLTEEFDAWGRNEGVSRGQAPSPRKRSIKDRLGYRPDTGAVRVTQSAQDPRGMVDYSDVDCLGLDDLF